VCLVVNSCIVVLSSFERIEQFSGAFFLTVMYVSKSIQDINLKFHRWIYLVIEMCNAEE
jgi:hypothetical protein